MSPGPSPPSTQSRMKVIKNFACFTHVTILILAEVKPTIQFLVVGFIVQLQVFEKAFLCCKPIGESSESSSSDLSESSQMSESYPVFVIVSIAVEEVLKKNDHIFNLPPTVRGWQLIYSNIQNFKPTYSIYFKISRLNNFLLKFMHMKYFALYLRMGKPFASKKSSINILKNNYHIIIQKLLFLIL